MLSCRATVRSLHNVQQRISCSHANDEETLRSHRLVSALRCCGSTLLAIAYPPFTSASPCSWQLRRPSATSLRGNWKRAVAELRLSRNVLVQDLKRDSGNVLDPCRFGVRASSRRWRTHPGLLGYYHHQRLR